VTETPVGPLSTNTADGGSTEAASKIRLEIDGTSREKVGFRRTQRDYGQIDPLDKDMECGEPGEDLNACDVADQEGRKERQ